MALAALLAFSFSACGVKPTESGASQSISEQSGESQSPLGAAGKKIYDYEGFIGCGYDVINSPFYQSDYVKLCPIDVEQMSEDGLIYEDVNAFRNTEFFTESGEDIYSYMSSLSVNAGFQAKSLFGGSLKVDFGLDTSSKIDEKVSFVKGSAVLTKVKQYVHFAKLSEKTLRGKYVYDGFREDYLLNEDVSPAELFELYGTHIIFSVSLGGKMDMNFLYTNTAKESSSKMKTSVKAVFEYVSASSSTAMNEDVKRISENSTYKINTYGGKVNVDMTSLEKARENYQEWATTIEDTSYLQLVKAGSLGNKTEMYPIWMLIDVDVPAGATEAEKAAAKIRLDRRNEISAEFDRLLEEAGKKLDNYIKPPVYIKDIYFGAGNNEANAKADLISKTTEKLTIIDSDLNMDAGGKWIYLGYTTTTEADEAIKDLVLHFHRNPDTTIRLNKTDGLYFQTVTGAEYTLRAEYDLNMGAGGDDIFLYYTKDEEAGSPIKGLFVQIIKVTGDLVDQKNWSRVCDWYEPGKKFDLNRNAGGKDIYLWMQR